MSEKTLQDFIIQKMDDRGVFLKSSLSIDDWEEIMDRYASYREKQAIAKAFEAMEIVKSISDWSEKYLMAVNPYKTDNNENAG